jgi:RNA polymerase sigma factor (sigma-70 family)
MGLTMSLPRTDTLEAVVACCRTVAADQSSDAELLARLTRQGDQVAFGTLLQRHGPMVLSVCRRLLHDSHDVSDAFQATFLVFLQKYTNLRRPDHLGPWLHGVAYRTACRLRQRAARREGATGDLDAVIAPSVQPLDEMARQEVRAIIDEEIECLPGKYRLPVVLCYLQGKSYAEAARSLGWPAGTVSVRLARAREQLRRRLVRRGVSAGLVGAMLAGEANAASVPAGILALTLNAGVVVAGIVPPGFSETVLTLTEGVIRAMWIQKLKSVLVASFVVAGLAVTALGGVSWYGTGKVAAQVYGPALPKAGPANERAGDDDSSLELQERKLMLELEGIRRQRAALSQRRASAVLEEIEASLRKLREATAGSARGRQAVETFAQAFERLKRDLRDGPRPPQKAGEGGGALAARNFRNWKMGLSLMVENGRVLQVDNEAKTALLSVGSKAGVRLGDVYRAYRASEGDTNQTAWLRVTEVHATWSIATITQNYAPRAALQAQDVIQRDEKN